MAIGEKNCGLGAMQKRSWQIRSDGLKNPRLEKSPFNKGDCLFVFLLGVGGHKHFALEHTLSRIQQSLLQIGLGKVTSCS